MQAPTSVPQRQFGRLHVLVAHRREARPLIDALALKPSLVPNKLFANEHTALLITGPGKVAMACGVGILHGTFACRNAAWLNVGVAGHRDAEIGTVAMVNKVTETSSNATWFPPPLIGRGLAHFPLETVAQPDSNYPRPVLYDMEAAAFCQAAVRFSTSELVQVVKVVSDNSEQPFNRKTAEEAPQLIAKAIPALGTVITELLATSKQLQEREADPAEFDEMCAAAHFTTTQKHQLRRLLRRWWALTKKPLPSDVFVADERSSSRLQKLEQLCEANYLAAQP